MPTTAPLNIAASRTRPSWVRVLLATAVLALLGGCLLGPPRPNPAQAETFRQQAEQLFNERDPAGAAAAMALAVKAEPADQTLHLRYGELLEIAQQPQQAAAAYGNGLAMGSPSAPLQSELSYRLALLNALKLQRLTAAQEALPALEPHPVWHKDLEAVIAIAQGDGRAALILLNEARSMELEKEMAARIYYHAARAYALLDARPQAMEALYQGINLAGATTVAKDIEFFWTQLKELQDPAQ